VVTDASEATPRQRSGSGSGCHSIAGTNGTRISNAGTIGTATTVSQAHEEPKRVGVDAQRKAACIKVMNSEIQTVPLNAALCHLSLREAAQLVLDTFRDGEGAGVVEDFTDSGSMARLRASGDSSVHGRESLI
jgi:hypothetical protein